MYCVSTCYESFVALIGGHCVTSCGDNEEPVEGICECADGFDFNDVTGQCAPAATSDDEEEEEEEKDEKEEEELNEIEETEAETGAGNNDIDSTDDDND